VARANDACSGTSDDTCRAASAALYDVLIAPIQNKLPIKLVIVPDTVLFDASFAALFDRQTKSYLVQKHQIAFSPSATFYARHQEVSSPRSDFREVLLVGNPSFDRESVPDLPSLAGAEAEVRDIARSYAGANVSVGSAATKRQFLDAARRGMLIHFAGHAVFDFGNAGQSALLFARSGNDNGMLSAAEIARTPMSQVPLLVLSACGTSRRVRGADGPFGIARAFLLAGVPAVVASTAPSEDTTGRDLFAAFHRRFTVSGDAASALRGAQLHLLQSPDPRLNAPRAWARFVVIV
jgi:CHAT domain-containing protein